MLGKKDRLKDIFCFSCHEYVLPDEWLWQYGCYKSLENGGDQCGLEYLGDASENEAQFAFSDRLTMKSVLSTSIRQDPHFQQPGLWG